MADAVRLAQDFWDIANEDPIFAANLKCQYLEVMNAIMSGSTVGNVISGTKNGASYTIRESYPLKLRADAMSLAIKGLANGVRPSRNRRIAF